MNGLTPDFSEGTRFKTNGEIKLLKKIATGGMGTVYQGLLYNVEGFQKQVAVKTLNSNLSSDLECISYFIHEAKLVANLTHENIVQLYSLGKYQHSYYMVYEFITGTNLQDFYTLHSVTGTKVPEEYVIFIVSQIARGLAHAHTFLNNKKENSQIVHRDVCPRNIMITTEGLPKLTDFGIAITREKSAQSNISGKPLYMSPEQAARKKVDFRSDIYSLGIVLFYLLTGEHTRDSTLSLTELIAQASNGYVNWRKFPCNTNIQLFEILDKMLAPNPGLRYSDTRELVADLEQYMYYKGYRTNISKLSQYLVQKMPFIFSPEKCHFNDDKLSYDDLELVACRNSDDQKTILADHI